MFEICGNTVFLRGELDLAVAGEVASADRRVIAARQAGDTVVVDVAGVTFLDAAGLRSLLEAQAEARSRGVDCRVVNLSPPVRRLLALVGGGELAVDG